MDWRVMGVVNVTPDSFSDGGRYYEVTTAVEQAQQLVSEGADIIDVGGESTRPGSDYVDEAEEITRVMPVLSGLADLDVTVSIDTRRGAVALAAADRGAAIINDITALRSDPELADIVAARGLTVCLMHMQGEPRTMQAEPRYDDVVDDVKAFLAGRVEFALSRGVPQERIWLDPGIGFGKTLEHNLELLRRLDELVALGLPVVLGTSRKAFLGRLTDRIVADQRVAATVATTVLGYRAGATIFRVHDVAANVDALKVAAATLGRSHG